VFSRRAEYETRAVARGKDGETGLRHGKIRFLLKEANDELLRILRGSLFHIEGAA